ncbi:MAG: DUF1385 domain-containing protein [Anaerolineales bacterium]|nr:DUF1385 domain-containing protein [Anaerolineales bacterium]
MSEEKLKMPNYGGQAVIEGVMMRGRNVAVVAMRNPDGEIVYYKEKLGTLYRSNLSKIPFLRGLVSLWDALGLGTKILTISANTQAGEDEKLEGPAMFGTLLFSIAFAVGLFFLVPAGIGHLFEKWFTLTSFWSNMSEGAVRLIILIGYMWGVSFMDEVKRVFAYHGAEHKTINAFENGIELIPEKVSECSREHPRCGTAFLLVLVVLSIILFTLLGPMSLGMRLLVRVLAIPVLAGVAYEYLRFTADHLDNPIIRILVKPNLALQYLSTREPDLEMLEVSIAAFKEMREEEAREEIKNKGVAAAEHAAI